jgi:hypothetical protein
VRVDLTGWTLETRSDTESRWHQGAGDLLSLHYFPLPPDIPAPLEQLPVVRARYRKDLASRGGGIVEVEAQPLAGLLAVRSIFKFPQQPTGTSYVASLTLPFAECSFVLKVQCPEQGTTGMRDSVILGQVRSETRFTTQEEFRRWMDEQWFQDPYDPADRSPVRRNQSEDPVHDARFPDHPLSRARRYLASLVSTLRISPALLQARPFTGPASAIPEAPARREHHYTFAHLALPQLFLSNPERFLGAMNQDGGAFLEHFWKKVGEQVPREQVLSSEGMAFDVRSDPQAVLAIVRLPPARVEAEALLVGCHYWRAPPQDPATPRARYFTLELRGQEAGQPQTFLGEWEQENGHLSHVNHGEGPHTVQDFIAAIQHRVLPSHMRS